MTAHGHSPHSDHDTNEESSSFTELMGEVMATAKRFGHREHIHLTWMAVKRYDTVAAVDLVSDGIQRTARYSGAPQKYNATVSRAWVELVGHHAEEADTADFDVFLDRNPTLLNKKLLTRFYRPATLASVPARSGWIEPDLAPLSLATGRMTRRAFPTTSDSPAVSGATPHRPGSPTGGIA